MQHVTSYTGLQSAATNALTILPTGRVDAMTKLPMSVEEYLRTSFEGADREYLAFGVKWVWLLDPDERTAFVFSSVNPTGRQVDDVLRTEDPTIEIPLVDAFAELPMPSDASGAVS